MGNKKKEENKMNRLKDKKELIKEAEEILLSRDPIKKKKKTADLIHDTLWSIIASNTGPSDWVEGKTTLVEVILPEKVTNFIEEVKDHAGICAADFESMLVRDLMVVGLRETIRLKLEKRREEIEQEEDNV